MDKAVMSEEEAEEMLHNRDIHNMVTNAQKIGYSRREVSLIENALRKLESQYSSIFIYRDKGTKHALDYQKLSDKEKYIVSQIKDRENGDRGKLFRALTDSVSNKVHRITFNGSDNPVVIPNPLYNSKRKAS